MWSNSCRKLWDRSVIGSEYDSKKDIKYFSFLIIIGCKEAIWTTNVMNTTT